MDSWSYGPGSDPHWYLKWKITPALQPLKETVVGSIQTVLWVVMGTIGTVMLIACTNVANLLVVRADARQQVLAACSALGAGRWRIARELLLESVTLGLLGNPNYSWDYRDLLILSTASYQVPFGGRGASWDTKGNPRDPCSRRQSVGCCSNTPVNAQSTNMKPIQIPLCLFLISNADGDSLDSNWRIV
jgi:hypothetical protein